MLDGHPEYPNSYAGERRVIAVELFGTYKVSVNSGGGRTVYAMATPLPLGENQQFQITGPSLCSFVGAPSEDARVARDNLLGYMVSEGGGYTGQIVQFVPDSFGGTIKVWFEVYDDVG